MATRLGKFPWRFDAASDVSENRGKFKLGVIQISGAAGLFTVLDESGGEVLVDHTLVAGEQVSFEFHGAWVESIFISAIPGGGEVLVFQAEPAVGAGSGGFRTKR